MGIPVRPVGGRRSYTANMNISQHGRPSRRRGGVGQPRRWRARRTVEWRLRRVSRDVEARLAMGGRCSPAERCAASGTTRPDAPNPHGRASMDPGRDGYYSHALCATSVAIQHAIQDAILPHLQLQHVSRISAGASAPPLPIRHTNLRVRPHLQRIAPCPMTNERWMMRGSSTLTRTYGEDDRKRLAAEHNNRTGMDGAPGRA